MATGDVKIIRVNSLGTHDESVLAKSDIEYVLTGDVASHSHYDMWKLARFGVTWTNKNASAGNTVDIAISADGKYQTVCSLQGYISKSSDYGATWTASNITGGVLQSIAMSADGKYQTTCNSTGYVFKSSDYGVTWVSQNVSGGNLLGIAMSANGKYQTTCSNEGYIRYSSNYGATWTSASAYTELKHMTMSADGKYQSMINANWGYIVKSSDYGVTWNGIGQPLLMYGMAMSADGKMRIVSNLYSQVGISLDYGETWEYIANIGRGPMAMSADGRYISIASESTANIRVSSDYGRTWNGVLNVGETQIAMSGNGKHIVVANSPSGYVFASVAEVSFGDEAEGGGGSEKWNEAYGWGDHALAGYMTNGGGVVLTQQLELYASGTMGGLYIAAEDGQALDATSHTGVAARGYSVHGIGVLGQSIGSIAGDFAKQGQLTASDQNPVIRVKRSTSGAFSQTGDLLEVDDSTTASGTVSGALYCGKINGNIKIYLNSRVADSSSAVAHMLDTLNTLSTAGSKLVSLRNNGVEKFALYYDGGIQTPTFKTTPEGGQAIRLVNKTGANSVKGTVVSASATTDNAFRANPVDGDMPIGIVYEDGIADGSDCWVVISGKAQVLMVNSVAATRSYVAYSSATVAGRIDTVASAPAALQHFREIGHTLESKTAGTNVLVLCIVHFN